MGDGREVVQRETCRKQAVVSDTEPVVVWSTQGSGAGTSGTGVEVGFLKVCLRVVQVGFEVLCRPLEQG